MNTFLYLPLVVEIEGKQTVSILAHIDTKHGSTIVEGVLKESDGTETKLTDEDMQWLEDQGVLDVVI